MLPTTAPTEVPATATTAPNKGAALVSERCVVCHSLDRVKTAKKSQSAWKATVDRMIGHGARLSADEAATVVEYLAATYK